MSRIIKLLISWFNNMRFEVVFHVIPKNAKSSTSTEFHAQLASQKKPPNQKLIGGKPRAG
jgi:hypothetical protein